MKVLALGGSGGMGRFAVETSMSFENIDEITVIYWYIEDKPSAPKAIGQNKL